MTQAPPWRRPPVGRLAQARRDVGSVVARAFFAGTGRVTRVLPLANPRLHGVELIEDVPFGTDHAEHQLDIYRPKRGQAPMPVVMYIHGGSFRICSRKTHWVFPILYARRGYLVFNVDYRLAPTHPYPAAVRDVFAAYRWVVEHAQSYGGDLTRLVVAGESAGANLATGLTLATCYRRAEPWAREVFDLGVVPKAVIAACGMLQVSDPERFVRRKGPKLKSFIADRIKEVADAYFRALELQSLEELDLADPLVALERGLPPERPLPPFFTPVGTADPLLDDTRRLAKALQALGGSCEARYYPGGIHAFHAFVFQKIARECWRDGFRFLEEVLNAPTLGAGREGAFSAAPGSR